MTSQTGTPLIVVLLNGGPLSTVWADEHCDAIVEAWYPGQEGGTAIAEVLFGAYNPAARLPVTVHRSVDDLPPFEDYSMAGRTYRYYAGPVLYPFGHGLSYTRFGYDNLTVSPATANHGDAVTITVEVLNAGSRSGDEVVQLYLQHAQPEPWTPRISLQGFRRVHLEPGARKMVTFHLAAAQMSRLDDTASRVMVPGPVRLWVGGGLPAQTGRPPGLWGDLMLTGAARVP